MIDPKVRAIYLDMLTSPRSALPIRFNGHPSSLTTIQPGFRILAAKRLLQCMTNGDPVLILSKLF